MDTLIYAICLLLGLLFTIVSALAGHFFGIHHAFLRTWFLFNPCSIVVQQKAPARASRAGAGGSWWAIRGW